MRMENRESAIPAADRGAEWVARMHSGQMTDDDNRALRAWLASSTKNNRDFLRAEAAWLMCGTLAGDPKIQAELARLRRKSQRRALLADWSTVPPGRLAAAAAVIFSIAIATLWLLASSNTDWHDTPPGEQHVVSLSDGSSVAINTNSRVGFHYSAHERHVALEKGEALFEVTRDTKRPFTVRAANGYVRAVGTRFNVLVQSDAVTVAVLEGRVNVVTQGDAGEERAELDVGQSIAYGRSGQLMPADPTVASPQRIVAWREGKLRFDAWSIERAIREHNRYSSKPLHLGDADLGQRLISGVFRIGDTSALVAALETLIDVKAVDQGEALVLVPADAPRDLDLPE